MTKQHTLFTFQRAFNGEWDVTYTGKDPDIVIPAGLIPEAEQHVSIRLHTENDSVTSISFPKDVAGVWLPTFYADRQLSHFEVDPQNPHLSSSDGVLFGDAGKTLLKVPAMKEGEYRVPEGVEKIGQGAFNNSRLSGIVLPDSLTEIPDYTFTGCHALRSVAIPAGVKELPFNTFSNTENLENFSFLGDTDVVYHYSDRDLPGEVENWISGESWDSVPECYLLACLKKYPAVKKYLRRFLAAALRGERREIYDWLSSMKPLSAPPAGRFQIRTLSETEAEIASYSGEEERITIPDRIDEKAIVSVGTGAFRRNDSCVRVVIPPGVRSIGRNAFSDCISLQEVILPDTCAEIGSAAFSGCKSLTRISLPPQITVLAEKTFFDCVSLKQLDLPQGLLHIKSAALKNCAHLESLTLPDSLLTLGSESLYHCGFNHGPKTEDSWGYTVNDFTIPAGVEKLSNAKEGLFARYPAAAELFGVFEYKIRLLVTEGSAAHRFAQKHGIPYRFSDAPDSTPKDGTDS